MRFTGYGKPNHNRVVGGKIAQSRGASIEKLIITNGDLTGWTVIRIPDGAKQVSHERFIRVTSPFDFIAFKNGWTLAFDVKTINAKSFCHSLVKTEQVKNLMKIDAQRVPAGYLIYFQPIDEMRFFVAPKIAILKKGESLKPKDGTLLGSFLDFTLDRIEVLLFDNENKQDANCETNNPTSQIAL